MEGAHPDYVASLHARGPRRRCGCLALSLTFFVLGVAAVAIAAWRAFA